jgi:hypothetical protein
MPLLEAGAAVAVAVGVDVTASTFALGDVAMVVGGGIEDEETEDERGEPVALELPPFDKDGV